MKRHTGIHDTEHMQNVKAKKHLGQHFLNDQQIARDIVDALPQEIKQVLEIGPGMGVLTQFLIEKNIDLKVVELDNESVDYLERRYIQLHGRIFGEDFLKMNLDKIFPEKFAIIGNFPYNISSQILFKVLENKEKIPIVVGMFQKEVAERVAAKPGSKTYGILSVLLQAYYDIEYLFTVHENVFTPPPKVKSGVIRVIRNNVEKLDCDETLFFKIVKTAFNQRRKTLRNGLKSMIHDPIFLASELFDKRAEQLSVEDFVYITKKAELK